MRFLYLFRLNLENFDILHAFLGLTVTKLSSLKTVRFFGPPCIIFTIALAVLFIRSCRQSFSVVSWTRCSWRESCGSWWRSFVHQKRHKTASTGTNGIATCLSAFTRHTRVLPVIYHLRVIAKSSHINCCWRPFTVYTRHGSACPCLVWTALYWWASTAITADEKKKGY